MTWDCRHEEPSTGDENSGLKSFTPFPAGAGANAGASDGVVPPKLADLAWNHNGQGEFCVPPTTATPELALMFIC